MMLYLFERIDGLTDSYHSEGGLVVIAEDRVSAQALVLERQNCELDEYDWSKAKEFELVGVADAQLFVFPDAGCF